MQLERFSIRQASVDDLAILQDIAAQMKSAKDADYFDLSMQYQAQGERNVLIAELDGGAIGYCMLSWTPKYAFYKSMGYPEIQDLNVLPEFRNRGFATQMIVHCENLVREKGVSHMGISVGLTREYGAAQRLYVRLGYVPDGYGVTYDRKPVSHAEFRPVDDDLCLMLIKNLQTP